MAEQVDVLLRVRADTRQAVQGFNNMRRGWGRLTQMTQRLRAGMLGMNTMLMGQGALFVGAGLAARGTVRVMNQYSEAQARIRGIIASASGEMRDSQRLMEEGDLAARRYGYGLSEASTAMGTLLETGVQAEEAANYFAIATEFSRAANVDLEGSTRVLVDVMRQFNQQGTDGARRLASVLTVASRTSSTSVAELQQSLRYAGVELSAMGFSAEDTAAALGAMSSIGLRGTTAGTRLRGAMLALTRITGRSRDIMTQNNLRHEELDTILTDEQGNLRRVSGIMARLNSIFSRLPTHAAKLNLATALFGRRAYAAGVILSGLHVRSEDFASSLQRLENTEQNEAAMSRAAEEQNRGFAAQLRFAKVAVQDLAVAFGDLLSAQFRTGEQGFGEYLRDLAMSVRLSDESARTTSAAREAYEALTPEMREQGEELRKTLSALAMLIRGMAWLGKHIGNLVINHTDLTIAVLSFVGALRMVGPTLLQNELAARSASTATAGMTRSWRNFGIASRGAQVMVGALMVDMAGRGSVALTDYIAQWTDLSHELEQADAGMSDFQRSMAALPVLGPWMKQIARLWELLEQARGVADTLEAQARTQMRQTEELRPEERIERGAEALARREGLTDVDRRVMAARRVQVDSMFEMAARFRNIGAQTESMITFRLRQQGMEEEQAAQLAARIRETQVQYRQDVEALALTQRRDAGFWRGTFGLMIEETERAVTNFQRLNDIVAQVPGAAGTAAAPAPVNDAFVTSTGFLPVSAGDMLIDRASLASALAGPAGSMVAGGGAQQVGATPQSQQPQNINMEGEFTIEVPLTIDGREIARAVGRHTLQVDQRRGVSISPGSRRRVAEAGVQ